MPLGFGLLLLALLGASRPAPALDTEAPPTQSDTLETIIVTPEQRWELVDGALATFAKLQKWVELQEVPLCANLQ